jgi:hypothetical protein
MPALSHPRWDLGGLVQDAGFVGVALHHQEELGGSPSGHGSMRYAHGARKRSPRMRGTISAKMTGHFADPRNVPNELASKSASNRP